MPLSNAIANGLTIHSYLEPIHYLPKVDQLGTSEKIVSRKRSCGCKRRTIILSPTLPAILVSRIHNQSNIQHTAMTPQNNEPSLRINLQTSAQDAFSIHSRPIHNPQSLYHPLITTLYQVEGLCAAKIFFPGSLEIRCGRGNFKPLESNCRI